MNIVAFIIAVVVGLLLAETRVSRVHAKRLIARGGVTPPGDVYRALAILYPAAFLVMGAEGLWRAALEHPGASVGGSPSGAPSWVVSGVLLFGASKALKYWAIRALGERWTFRVFIVPDLPLVRSGPYRFIAHPNYLAVVGELVGTAMMVGARTTGPAMLAVFGVALWIRVRFETRVLRGVAAKESATRNSTTS